MKRQLLVVDGDPGVLCALSAILEQQGYAPILAESWAAAKQALAARAPGPAAEPGPGGGCDLAMDAGTQSVRVRGAAVSLTRKEFELLRLFVANRGAALSRDFIRKQVWDGSQLYAWSRVIDVHVRHLRQKLEQDPLEPKLIVTVPGVGYRFEN